ncbi:hypothetical protein GCM10007390_15080 [Persicitalea jodogahamensis]|uniref:LTD domain-containing protein n=2 Tax=Persicitalea jodogahamensis TaxID=402147 RepID=A0A8J3D7N7_9BACT|nr:hypothetical protein GCM10007390_15080 [Persicitalea jodogahamensis]
MASNGNTIVDELGEHEDWVEIYNPGSSSVDIGGYYVSDKLDNLTKYRLPAGDPATVIPANGFLILWASDEPSRGTLHLPFKLSAGGEAFAITAPDGNTLINSLSFDEQQTDISYGRYPDGAANLFFFSGSTPGASNNTAAPYNEVLAAPDFSVAAGFYTSDVQLSIETDAQDATIYYTLDGSDPSPDHVGGTTYQYKNKYEENPGDIPGELLAQSFESYVYESTISLSDRAADPNKISEISTTYDNVPDYFPAASLNKANVVRAIVAKPGALSSEIVTKSYFINSQGRSRYTLPVVSLAVQENKLFDYNDGISVAGVAFDNWRAANPSQAPIGFVDANYLRRGRETEMEGNFEYYDSGNEPGLNQRVGVRIHGGASRAYPRKGLRLYARSEYGESEFEYPFFPEKPRDYYKRLLLRSSGSDWDFSLFRDAVAQRVVSHLPFDTQASQPSVLFLNGEYWGLHNLRERLDKHYLETTYGVNADSVDILENRQEVQEGDNARFLALLDYLNANSLTDSANFAYVETQIDPKNFTDYQIAEIHSGNNDWVDNNIEYWRKQTSQYEPNAPYGHDGRWRWFMYDLDEGYRLYNNGVAINILDRATSTENGYESQTRLLRKMLENTDYRNYFINRFADLLNTTFKPSRIERFVNEYKAEIDPEIDEHIARWNHPGSRAEWESNVAETITFAQERPAYVRSHIREKFGLPAQHDLTLGVSDVMSGYVRVNTVDLVPATPGVEESTYPWTGIYFQDVPITLTAHSKSGHTFSYWQEGGTTISTDSTLVLPSLTEARTITAIFDGQSDCRGDCRSLSSGNWNEASRWSCGHVPLACEAVVISEGHTIALPTGIAKAKSVEIENGALLDMGDDASLQLGN